MTAPTAQPMTSGDEPLDVIPTVGELAEQALDAFQAFERFDQATSDAYASADMQRTAHSLVNACLGLLGRFPRQSQLEFAATLPFTDLEVSLLAISREEPPNVSGEMARRVYEWVHRSPIMVDEHSVHVASFLVRLSPHLDLWDQREMAAQAADRARSLNSFTDAR